LRRTPLRRGSCASRKRWAILLAGSSERNSPMNPHMEQAIALAAQSVRAGGGPFAALVVKDGVVLATGVNQVVRSNDPTAHAEIVAIRAACQALGSNQLSGCDVYASCEPCPMCLGALYWARPARVFFAATRQDAASAGFDDAVIYEQLAVPWSGRSLPMFHIRLEAAASPFTEWAAKPDKTRY